MDVADGAKHTLQLTGWGMCAARCRTVCSTTNLQKRLAAGVVDSGGLGCGSGVHVVLVYLVIGPTGPGAGQAMLPGPNRKTA